MNRYIFRLLWIAESLVMLPLVIVAVSEPHNNVINGWAEGFLIAWTVLALISVFELINND